MVDLDIPAIFSRGLATFWWVIPLALIGWLIETSWFKGKYGEFLVARAFKKYLNPDRYTVLHNITIETQDGSTQIDHIVVSPCGIFVIETKNMSGWIFASVNNKRWTQTFHRHKFPFQNSLRQNYKHLKALAELTGISETKFHSVVIFTGSAQFRTAVPQNVTCRSGGVMYIRSFDIEILSVEEMSSATRAIQSGKLTPGFVTNRAHVAGLVQRHQSPSCARCGSAMVKRTAKNGPKAGSEFWGCSSFPKCRETRPI